MKPHELLGKYESPVVSLGTRVFCLYRDADCVITSITNARIPWPRVQQLGIRGGSGLWVNDELIRAIKTESLAAICHWWGASMTSVHKWRVWAGVDGHTSTPGSAILHHQFSTTGGRAMQTHKFSKAERKVKSVNARRLKLIRYAAAGRWFGFDWTEDEIALLGTESDKVIAGKIGRTANAVRSMRVRLRIPNAK